MAYAMIDIDVFVKMSDEELRSISERMKSGEHIFEKYTIKLCKEHWYLKFDSTFDAVINAFCDETERRRITI